MPIAASGDAATRERLLAVTATGTGWLAVGHDSHDATVMFGPQRTAAFAPVPATAAMGVKRPLPRVARTVDQDPHTGQIVVGGFDLVSPLPWHQHRRPVLIASEDGRNWTDLAPPGVGGVSAVHAAAEPGPLAIGYDGKGLAVWAPERGAWPRRSIYAPALPPDVLLVALVWTGHRFVAVGDHHPANRCRPFVALSEDGWWWRPAHVGSARFAEGVWGRMNAVVMAGDLLVAVGAENGCSSHHPNGAIWVSQDGGERWELIHIDNRQPGNVELHAVAVDRADRLWAAGSVHHVNLNRAEPVIMSATEPDRWHASEVIDQPRPAQSKATVQALTSTSQGLVAVGTVDHLAAVELGSEWVAWEPDDTH